MVLLLRPPLDVRCCCLNHCTIRVVNHRELVTLSVMVWCMSCTVVAPYVAQDPMCPNEPTLLMNIYRSTFCCCGVVPLMS